MLAYIDPGAGSFVLQALLATLAGALVALRGRWGDIKRRLGLSRSDDDERPPAGED